MHKLTFEYKCLYKLLFITGLYEKISFNKNAYHILEMKWHYLYSDDIIAKQLNLTPKRIRHIYQDSVTKLFNLLEVYSIKQNSTETNVYLEEIVGFDIKTKNLLKKMHINTLQQLSQLSKNDLHKCRGFSDFTVNYLETILTNYHLNFKE